MSERWCSVISNEEHGYQQAELLEIIVFNTIYASRIECYNHLVIYKIER